MAVPVGKPAVLNSRRLVSAVGVMKSKVKWLPPTTNSLTRLLVGFQRQFAAMFHGSRNVSTRHGMPGNGGEPRLVSSQIVFCWPFEYRTKVYCLGLKTQSTLSDR